ncbi:hypothetical protein FF125_17345 [Aureibaculum algae]|uniref:Uncharacterized protein n=1 Tax=Aureibaculum algae TaxID=2584122 RepID=A0A5B7TTG3_9FLAO|nr:hypothetical protein [Aureibaculum algae]QCX40125.1 hypothetical protein FF125_17345 [Aureibaculum algae]
MALTTSEKHKIHRFHNLNKRSLENAINLIKENIKLSYKEEVVESVYKIKQPFNNIARIKLIENVRSYNRILLGLLASWSDESIRRLFYEPNVFSENQIEFLLDKHRSLEQKWTFALKIAFLKANNLIPIGNETCVRLTINSRNFPSLTPDLINKYREIETLIKDFLIPAFSIRNKVQHGEWIAAFKPPDSKIYSPELTKKIFKENIITISSRMIIFNSVYQMIIDLARFNSNNFKIDSSSNPFEYFYSQHIKKINNEKVKITSSKINEYINQLITKKENGKKYRIELKSNNQRSNTSCITVVKSYFNRLFRIKE